MIEVFKTNVNDVHQANLLIAEIHGYFNGYRANFDLEDCDRILRIENINGLVSAADIIALLGKNGFMAEVLEDSLMDQHVFVP
jgi:hypothetical protein